MSESRQLIIFLLCVVSVLLNFWTLSETMALRLSVAETAMEAKP